MENRKDIKATEQSPATDTTNYKDVAMAASATLTLVVLAARLSDGQFTSYLTLGSYLMTSGLAAHNLGFEKSKQMLTNSAATLFSGAKAAYEKAAGYAKQNNGQMVPEAPRKKI